MKTIKINEKEINVPTTKQEVAEWLQYINTYGHGCWVAVNGGGLAFVGLSDTDMGDFITDILSDDYCSEVEVLQKGEEFEDFLGIDGYEETDCFLRLSYCGELCTDLQIQIQYWFD